MRSVALRSVCCGVAAAVVSAPGYIFALIWYESSKMPAIPRDPTGARGEVGWDVITIAHNAPVVTWAWFVAAFAIGFWLGFRYFSKRSAAQGASKKI
jgi:hypothetical protein